MRIDEDGFSRMLKGSLQKNIIFIYGDDDYLKNFYCNKLVSACVPEEMQTFNLHIFDDENTPFEDIFEISAGYPMMSDKMLLLIRNYNLSSLKKEKLASFMENLRNVPESTVMVFYFDTVEVEYGQKWKPTPWNAVIDAFDTDGVVAELNSRTPEKLASMLVKRAGAHGSSISAENARYLVDMTGTDMQNLVNEFNKVCAYSGGEEITKKMIDDVCVRTVSADVFMICDSLFSHNNDVAFAVLNELIRLGVSGQEILGAMNSTFVNMYRIKAALNNNHRFEDIVKLFGMNKGQEYSARKLVATVTPMRIGTIRRCLEYLSDADVRIKRTSADDTVVLTELIAMLGEVLKNA